MLYIKCLVEKDGKTIDVSRHFIDIAKHYFEANQIKYPQIEDYIYVKDIIGAKIKLFIITEVMEESYVEECYKDSWTAWDWEDNNSDEYYFEELTEKDSICELYPGSCKFSYK